MTSINVPSLQCFPVQLSQTSFWISFWFFWIRSFIPSPIFHWKINILINECRCRILKFHMNEKVSKRIFSLLIQVRKIKEIFLSLNSYFDIKKYLQFQNIPHVILSLFSIITEYFNIISSNKVISISTWELLQFVRPNKSINSWIFSLMFFLLLVNILLNYFILSFYQIIRN